MENIYELAKRANEANELNNSEIRFWISGGRYFICYDIMEMDNIDEVNEKEFISKIERILN